MKQPKFSEVLRAAAEGVMRPYRGGGWGPTGHVSGGGGPGQSYSASDRAHAESMAGMFSALAELYERYEQSGQ